MRIIKNSYLFLSMLILQACQFTSISETFRPTIKHSATDCTHEGGNDEVGNTRHIILDGDAPLSVSDSITGYEFHDYVFFGKKDSQLSALFSSRHAFPILLQENRVHLNLNTEEMPYIIPETGCYRLRILMMRAFSRRGIETPYQMTLNVIPESEATARH